MRLNEYNYLSKKKMSITKERHNITNHLWPAVMGPN